MNIRNQKKFMPLRVRSIWLFTGLLITACVCAGNSASWKSSPSDKTSDISSWTAQTESQTEPDAADTPVGSTDYQSKAAQRDAGGYGVISAQPEQSASNETNRIDSALFRLTVYTPYCDGGVWGYQTAMGVRSEHLITCAVDPNVIPLGSTIEIGDLTLLAVDTGSAVKGHIIDIFYDGPIEEACRWLSDFGSAREAVVIEGQKTAA